MLPSQRCFQSSNKPHPSWCAYSVNFGHYVPLPFTVTVNEPQTYSLQTTSGTLMEAFKNPKTKLITLDSFKSAVADGYCMFRDLVALSGQPSLDPYARLPLAPLQMVDQSILDHLHNWELYLDKLLMHGQWLSDWYFIESLHTSAKPEMRTKFTAQLRNDMKSDCPDIDKPLPSKYYPCNLRTAFVMIARGEYGDLKVASMLVHEMTRGSCAMTAPSLPCRPFEKALERVSNATCAKGMVTLLMIIAIMVLLTVGPVIHPHHIVDPTS